MAVPPRPPVRYVYVIGPAAGLQKVGMATNPRARLAQLQTASPHDLVLHESVAVPFDLAPAVERHAHRALIRHCVRSEWFEVSPEAAVAALDAAVTAIAQARAPSAPARSWRLARPLRTTWRPPDLEPLRRAVERAAEASAAQRAGPLFAYSTQRPARRTEPS
jgi:hypothetical protein